MGANVSTAMSSGTARRRRGPPTDHAGPAAGGERRLDIHVYDAADGRPVTGRAWERCVWRDARVLIAECPAPHLPVSIENALRAIAARIARDLQWEGLGTVSFALDDRSGVFRVLGAQAVPRSGSAPAEDGPAGPLAAAHALELRIDNQADRRLPPMRMLVCGATRGEALRRAHRALSEMPGPAVVDRAFLMNLIASRAFCSGLTGTRLDRAVG